MDGGLPQGHVARAHERMPGVRRDDDHVAGDGVEHLTVDVEAASAVVEDEILGVRVAVRRRSGADRTWEWYAEVESPYFAPSR